MNPDSSHSVAGLAASTGGWLLFCLALLPADVLAERPHAGAGAISDLFEAQGLDGTVVVASAAGETVYVHNEKRAATRFSPASTFKIPNTLIALDTGTVDSAESSFAWDGKTRGVAAWNRDQTLRSAFKVSCVWCYQEIAREVGASRYAAAFSTIRYGNEDTGQQVDQFWLNGDLTISAFEQIEFLRDLYGYQLPFSKAHVDIVKSIMRDDESNDYELYAKSGWTGPALHVGWYVGYVEKDGNTWLFAMNIHMDKAEQAPLRKELAIRSLQVLGLL